MSEVDPHRETAARPQSSPAHVAPPGEGDTVSVGRRRALLKGLSRAAAVAGAAVPISSLATGEKAKMRASRNGKTVQCSVSGHTSELGSLGIKSLPECVGNNHACYREKVNNKFKNWPKSGGVAVCPVGASNYTEAASFKQIFKGGSSTSIGALMSGTSTTAEARWVVALLNATTCASTYPYTPSEVIVLYGKSPAQQSAALSLFAKYLEG